MDTLQNCADSPTRLKRCWKCQSFHRALCSIWFDWAKRSKHISFHLYHYMQEHSLWFKWRALRWLWQAFTTILLGTLLGTLFGMFSIASKSLGVCILWKNAQQHPMIIMVLHGEPFFKPNFPGLCGCKCSNSLCYVDPIPCGYISLRCECICEFWECSDDDVNLWSWP